MANPSPPAAPRSKDIGSFADRAVFKLAKHWLLLANLFWGLYVGLPLLAPVLMNAGWTAPAKIIYTVYRPACHQLPERSFFLGGEEHVYSAEELAGKGVEIHPLSRDIGNQTVGWKTGFCQRDLAIYGAIFLTGLVYGVVRGRVGRWKMPFRYFAIFIIPMAVDGILQLVGVHESNWILRTITGVIFGVGAALFAYPYLEEGFRDVRNNINSRQHLE